MTVAVQPEATNMLREARAILHAHNRPDEAFNDARLECRALIDGALHRLTDIIHKLSNAHETLDGLRADQNTLHPEDDRFDEVLNTIAETMDALRAKE